MAQPAPVLGLPVDDGTELTHKAWRLLQSEMKALGTPLPEPVIPILDFRAAADANPMSREERLAIIQQAELMFEHLYPHLPFKTELFHLMRPGEFLRTVRARVDTLSETAFHGWLLSAFALVRDAHTVYGLPSPYRGATAFLPFQMATVIDPGGQRRFIVSRVMNTARKAGFGHPFFVPGAEIVEWEGCPIDQHVNRAAGRLPGGNPSAEFARATLACTIRPLTFCHFPFEEEMPTVEVVYRSSPMAEDVHAISLPWGVVRFPSRATFPTKSFSISTVNEEFNRGVRGMCREGAWTERKFRDSKDPRAVSEIPDVFEFQFTGGPRDGHPINLAHLAVEGLPGLRLGYLRIKSFSDGSDAPGATDRMVKEARRILTLLDEEAPDGLIIDIRGNPGGDIEAAERMLQMLTPHPVTPENFHFANTEAVVGVLRRIRAGLADPAVTGEARAALEEARLEFEQWLDDADGDPHVAGGGVLTSGRPLTSPDGCNDTGQVYHGRVVLLTDAFTYSAADIFAAGFEDHDIGCILGKDGSTGGGGANVWNHTDLLTKLGPQPGIPLAALPRDASMRLAIRRCSRVGKNEGRPVEDMGVTASRTYVTNTVEDVLAGMPGMISEAADIIVRRMPLFRVDVPRFKTKGDGAIVETQSTNVTRLIFYLDGKVSGEGLIAPGQTSVFEVEPVAGLSEPSVLRIEGYSDLLGDTARGSTLVTVRNIALRAKPDAEQSDAEESVKSARRRRRAQAARRVRSRRRRR